MVYLIFIYFLLFTVHVLKQSYDIDSVSSSWGKGRSLSKCDYYILHRDTPPELQCNLITLPQKYVDHECPPHVERLMSINASVYSV